MLLKCCEDSKLTHCAMLKFRLQVLPLMLVLRYTLVEWIPFTPMLIKCLVDWGESSQVCAHAQLPTGPKIIRTQVPDSTRSGVKQDSLTAQTRV